MLSRLGAAIRGNPLDNPSVPLNQAGFLFSLFGGGETSAGVHVNEKTALGLSTVYACISVLSNSFGTMPCKLYERTKSGRKPVTEGDLFSLLAVEPNPNMTAVTFWSAVMACAALRGNGYAIIQRDKEAPGGVPVANWPIHPSFVQTRLNPATRELEHVVSVDGKQTVYPDRDMFHVPALTMDGLVGIDPLTTAARQSIGTAIAGAKHIGAFFGRGSRPSGVLTRSAQQPQAGTLQGKTAPENNDKARESWERANAGDNQGRTAVLPAGWDWKPIAITPEQSQYLQIRQFERAELAALWSIPPHMVGDTSRLSNSNHESQALEFVKFTLLPWIVRFEAEINRKLLPRVGRNASRYIVSFDTSELIRGDFDAQMTGFATGRQWGFVTANECRTAIGYDPIDGPAGDAVILPLNMVSAKQLFEEPIPDPAPSKSVEGPGNADNQSDGSAGGNNNGDDYDAQSGGSGNGGQNQRAASKNQTKLLDRMADAYRGIFRDGVGRFNSRTTRGADTVQQIFGAVLSSIADESVRQAQQTFRLPAEVDLGTEKLLRDTAKQLEKRTASWTATTADADADHELRYCVNAIANHVFREAGSTIVQKA
jgi:HK97 family phage portal protein